MRLEHKEFMRACIHGIIFEKEEKRVRADTYLLQICIGYKVHEMQYPVRIYALQMI